MTLFWGKKERKYGGPEYVIKLAVLYVKVVKDEESQSEERLKVRSV